jgi:hypothetical protein
VTDHAAIPALLERAGLADPRPVILLIGGAGRLSGAVARRVAPLFDELLPDVATEIDAAVVDGGTDSGVMRLAGSGWARRGCRQPLVGVAARGTVASAGGTDDARPASGATAPPEPHHSHLFLVPGTGWGDERPWLIAIARAIARERSVTTLVVNGGPLTRLDAEAAAAAGWPVIVATGSGRMADTLASSSGPHPGGMSSRGRFRVLAVPVEDAVALRAVLTRS